MTTSIKAKLCNGRTNEHLYLFKCGIKILIKFFEKLLKYRIMFKDILTFLGLDYRDASLIILYLVVLGTIITKSDE